MKIIECQTKISEVSLTNRLQEMEGRITGVEDKVKEQMDNPDKDRLNIK